MALLTLFNIIVAVALCAGAQKCPDLFLRFSKDHTFCKPPNAECQILRSGLTQGDLDTILEEHNKQRSNVATGRVENFPSAGNMMQMVWDRTLAAVAQAHANQCSFEHDCYDCRRVPNFPVGQIISNFKQPKGSSLPVANWKRTVQFWFAPVTDMNLTCGPTCEKVTWAESWRVGCGFVIQDAGSEYIQFYTCNYGPKYVASQPTYKHGPSCSECPVNSCCGESCEGSSNYPGLCKITDDQGPVYKPPGIYTFYCDWQNQDDCEFSIDGEEKWLTKNSLEGRYLSIVLKGGEESTLTFAKLVKPASNASSCYEKNYRLGPNVDGQEESFTAKAVHTQVSLNHTFERTLGDYSRTEFRHQWYVEYMRFDKEMQLKIVFSVPAGKPDQFLEIKNVLAYNGPCNR